MGQAPPGDSYNSVGEGLPLIAGAGDFTDGRLAPTKFTTKPTKVASAGWIVLSIRASIGARVWSDGNYCLGRGVAGLAPGPLLDRKYLWHAIQQLAPALVFKGKGATFLQVSKDDIAQLTMTLPNLPEQRRIAAILDQADALRAKRRQVLAHLDTLRRSLFSEMFGKAPWDAQLSDLAEVQIGPFGSLLHKVDYVMGGVPLINPMHIQDGRLRPDKEFSVSEKKASTLALYRLQEGDVVLGRRGEMGRAGVVESEHEGMLCGTGSLILRPRGEDSQFVHALLTSARMKAHLERESLGATLPNLNSTIVKSAPAPRIPQAEQWRFAHMTSAADLQLSRAEAHSRRLDSMFGSLQYRAFQGEL